MLSHFCTRSWCDLCFQKASMVKSLQCRIIKRGFSRLRSPLSDGVALPPVTTAKTEAFPPSPVTTAKTESPRESSPPCPLEQPPPSPTQQSVVKCSVVCLQKDSLGGSADTHLAQTGKHPTQPNHTVIQESPPTPKVSICWFSHAMTRCTI